MIYRILGLLLVLFLAASCGSPQAQSQPLPTLFLTPTPEYGDPELAEQVASNFLHAWQNSNFQAMYDLITQASRDATSFEAFQSYYEDAYDVIRLESLTFRLLTESQDNFRVIRYGYEVTFTSSVLGEFTDPERELTLALDEESQQWQVAWSPGNIFAEMGQAASLRYESFPPKRANIYDRDGNILADMNGEILSLSIIPGQIPDYDACMSTLSQVLDIPVEDVQAKLATYSADQLADVGLIETGVYSQWNQTLESDCRARFDSHPTRRYISGDLMPHILGYVGYPDEDEIPEIEAAGFPQDVVIGRSGIEQSWDEVLRGRPGGRLSLVTPDGQLLRVLAEHPPQPPQSVYLTIDSDLQRFALRTITDAFAKNGENWGHGGSIIIMDVNTGSILAMVSYPTFNANAFNAFPVMGQDVAQGIVQAVQEDERDPLLNRPTQGLYPTGSTMKVVSAIAALDSGVYTFDEKYTSTGTWNRDIPRSDWRPGGHGSVTLQGALTVSCNTCFYEAGYRMNETDPWILPNYANRLGLGRSTGLTDMAEATGLIGNPDNKSEYENTGVPWNFSDAVNIAIGQGGVQVTPLQLLRVYDVVANGGTLYRPQLVLKTGLLDEFSYEMTPDPMENIGISQEILDYVRGGLCAVTTASYGTAEFIFHDSSLQNIGVCGKTGTAQDPPRERTHAWFVGYAPRENPEVIVITMIENAGEGSEVAAPIVRRILEYYFFGAEGVSPS